MRQGQIELLTMRVCECACRYMLLCVRAWEWSVWVWVAWSVRV